MYSEPRDLLWQPLASNLFHTFAAVQCDCCFLYHWLLCRAPLQLEVNVRSCHIGFTVRMSCQLERNVHICLSAVITSGTLISHISDCPHYMA